MTLRLSDTYTRSVRDFVPLRPPEFSLYTCGPTVYDYAHLGNLRTYLFEDLLRWVLAFNGYRVKHVMNLTDVGHLVSDADTGEGKMEQGSRRTGKSTGEIAAFYTQAFKDDLGHLNILEPTIWYRATEHIPEQIDTIGCIEAKGLTYRTSDGIYFDTSRLPTYGHLARLDIEGLQAGMGVDMGEKRYPTDFVLWKFSPLDQKRQMECDSPWGWGSPAGISNAQRWRPGTCGRSLTCIVAVKITSRCIIPMRLRRPRPAMAPVSRTFGCMGPFYRSTTPRWRDRRETSCACRPWWNGSTIRWRIASSV